MVVVHGIAVVVDRTNGGVERTPGNILESAADENANANENVRAGENGDVDDGDGAHHAEEEEVPEHPKQETPTSVDDFPPASSSRVRPRDIAVGKDLLGPRRRSRNQANLVGSLHVAVRPHDLYLRVRF